MSVFSPETERGRAVVQRDREDGPPFKINMSPREGDKATHVVGLALSMSELERKPPHITNTPFVVRFYPDQVYALERTDIKGSMPFRLGEGDDLIKAIQMAVSKTLNEQLQGRAARAVSVPDLTMASDEPL